MSDSNTLTSCAALNRIAEKICDVPHGEWVYKPYDFDTKGTVRVKGHPEHVVALSASGNTLNATPPRRDDTPDQHAAIGEYIASCNPQALQAIIATVVHLEQENASMRRILQFNQGAVTEGETKRPNRESRNRPSTSPPPAS